jgi:hypothetical protein
MRSILYIISDTKVADYKIWRIGFDKAAPLRDKARLKVVEVFRYPDNLNQVIILFEEMTEGAWETYTSMPQVQEGMKHSGVQGKPDVKKLEKAPKVV